MTSVQKIPRHIAELFFSCFKLFPLLKHKNQRFVFLFHVVCNYDPYWDYYYLKHTDACATHQYHNICSINLYQWFLIYGLWLPLELYQKLIIFSIREELCQAVPRAPKCRRPPDPGIVWQDPWGGGKLPPFPFRGAILTIMLLVFPSSPTP